MTNNKKTIKINIDKKLLKKAKNKGINIDIEKFAKEIEKTFEKYNVDINITKR